VRTGDSSRFRAACRYILCTKNNFMLVLQCRTPNCSCAAAQINGLMIVAPHRRSIASTQHNRGTTLASIDANQQPHAPNAGVWVPPAKQR
jgi:hypothetical protein